MLVFELLALNGNLIGLALMEGGDATAGLFQHG
jgi:hypothetical protein